MRSLSCVALLSGFATHAVDGAYCNTDGSSYSCESQQLSVSVDESARQSHPVRVFTSPSKGPAHNFTSCAFAIDSETVNTDTREITYNGCPNHPITNAVCDNPNKAYEKSTKYKIPLYPEYMTSSSTALNEVGGAIGVTFGGEAVYSPYGGQQYGKVTDYDSSAVAAEVGTFDQCGGHSSSSDSVS